MSFVKITAVVRESKLNRIITKLYEKGVPGVSVLHLRGYGEYVNTSSHDLLDDNVKLEIMAQEIKADDIAHLILNEAHTGLRGDGIIAISPLLGMYRIRDKKRLNNNDLE